MRGPLSVFALDSINMTFNDDLRTEQGTPPFTPTGVTSTGAGVWTNAIK